MWRVYHFVAGALLCLITASVSGQGWSSGESYTPMPGHHHPAFEIVAWGTADGRHFDGHFMYSANRYTDDPPVATLNGKRRGDTFCPNVTFQVSRDWRGPWKTVKRSFRGRDTLTVDRQKGYASLEIDLDAFKPWLGKLRCGRVLLQSGEAATFDIANLLPPDKRPKPGE